MTAKPSIRQGREADLEGLLSIERASATAPHWSEAEYARVLTDRQRYLPVAEIAGSIIGFAVVAALTRTAELESIVVEQQARGHGIGAALCAAVLAWCEARGLSAVELEVRAASLSARRLYQRAGFREVARRPRYYADPEDDAVLMRVDLPGR